MFDPTRHNPNYKRFRTATEVPNVQGFPGAEGRYEGRPHAGHHFRAAGGLSQHRPRHLPVVRVLTIDANAEANVIEPLRRSSARAITRSCPVLSALFKSKHFFDSANVGCMIKSTLDFLVDAVPAVAISVPTSSSSSSSTILEHPLPARGAISAGHRRSAECAGWTAYYQFPQYNKLLDQHGHVSTQEQVFRSDCWKRPEFYQGLYPLWFDAIPSFRRSLSPAM